MQNKEDKNAKNSENFTFALSKTQNFYSGVFEVEFEGVRTINEKPIINVNIPIDYKVTKPYSENSYLFNIKGNSKNFSQLFLRVKQNTLNIKLVDNNKKTFEGTLESFLSALISQVDSIQENNLKK